MLQRLLRESRNLGDRRFGHLLWRNAALRVLVQDEVIVSDTVLQEFYNYRYGPRYEARLIVVSSLQEATEVIKRATSGESYIDLAVHYSTDLSRAQGGLLDRISTADATWPLIIRQTVSRLREGQISQALVLDGGVGILKLQRIIPAADVSFDQVARELADEAQRQMERRHMDRLTRQILEDADLLVVDRALAARWRQYLSANR